MAGDRPLKGYRVIDLSRILAGPLGGQMLADMGADVIKVEAPWGDDNRKWDPFNDDGESCNFLSVNRAKRSLTIDLKQAAGKEVLWKLLQDADVLLHSFLPDTARKLGVDYAHLHARFPRLVVCSLTGYGAEGAMCEVPAYDAMLQAFTGAMSVTGESGRMPVRAGISVVDMVTGVYGYSGVVTALLERERSPERTGKHVTISLLETGLALLGYHATTWFETGSISGPQGSGSEHIVPYQAFRCSDGYAVIAANNPSQWKRFMEVMGLPHLAEDQRFIDNSQRVKNRGELLALLDEKFMANTSAFWIDRMLAAGVAAAPVHRVDQALSHPQSIANNMVVSIEEPGRRPRRCVGLPFKVGDTREPVRKSPPQLGQHTDEILGELGYRPEEIARMRQARSI